MSVCMHIHREIVELIRRDELLDWGEFEATFGPVLRDGVEDGPATTVFQLGDALGRKQWEDFRKRVIEHVSIITAIFKCTHSNIRRKTMK